jgi:hypothetical protein
MPIIARVVAVAIPSWPRLRAAARIVVGLVHGVTADAIARASS